MTPNLVFSGLSIFEQKLDTIYYRMAVSFDKGLFDVFVGTFDFFDIYFVFPKLLLSFVTYKSSRLALLSTFVKF